MLYVKTLFAIDKLARGAAQQPEGEQAIQDGLYPQSLALVGNVGNEGAHRVHLHKALDTKGRGEETTKGSPEGRNVALRPRHATKEEEHHRGEHHHDHNIFALTQQASHGHSKEDACQQVRQDKDEEAAWL